MARQVVNDPNEDPQHEREPIRSCWVCEGTMALAYDRYQQKVLVCNDCNTSLSIPGSAWQVANAKRALRSFQGVERRRLHRRATDLQMQ